MMREWAAYCSVSREDNDCPGLENLEVEQKLGNLAIFIAVKGGMSSTLP